MRPFEESDSSHTITEHYAALKNLPIKIRETELPALEAIMNNKHFDKIANAFQRIEDYFGCELTTADKPFISLKVLEIEVRREDDDRLDHKMHESIQKLQEIIASLEEHNSLII